MVPFPSSSHFLVLLQSLENANPFICLCVNWWLSRPATKDIWLEDFSGKRQQKKLEICFLNDILVVVGLVLSDLRILILLCLDGQSQNMDSSVLTAINKKENTKVTLNFPFYWKFVLNMCFWPALETTHLQCLAHPKQQASDILFTTQRRKPTHNYIWRKKSIFHS